MDECKHNQKQDICKPFHLRLGPQDLMNKVFQPPALLLRIARDCSEVRSAEAQNCRLDQQRKWLAECASILFGSHGLIAAAAIRMYTFFPDC